MALLWGLIKVYINMTSTLMESGMCAQSARLGRAGFRTGRAPATGRQSLRTEAQTKALRAAFALLQHPHPPIKTAASRVSTGHGNCTERQLLKGEEKDVINERINARALLNPVSCYFVLCATRCMQETGWQ